MDGKPLLLIYRVSRLPDPAATASLWREDAKALGVGDLFLANVQSFAQERIDPASIGFDAAIEFQPTGPTLVVRYGDRETAHRLRLRHGRRTHVREASAVVSAVPLRRPGWDNTARRKLNGLVLSGLTPEAYRRCLECAIQTTAKTTSGERVVFVNAWNEWAEGAHLEPSRRWGRRYLEATRAALQRPMD